MFLPTLPEADSESTAFSSTHRVNLCPGGVGISCYTALGFLLPTQEHENIVYAWKWTL